MATLGQQLRELRLQRGLTPDEISHETYIPARVLLDLEDDDYSRFDSVIYIKSFLTNYGKFLDWDLRPLLKNLSTQADITHAESIFRGTHTPLKDTEAPKPVRERRMPVMLAPICLALFGFVTYCLYALCTKAALPFQPAFQDQSAQATPPATTRVSANLVGQANLGPSESDFAAETDSQRFPPLSTTEDGPIGRPLAELDLHASSSFVIDIPEIAGQPIELLP